MLLILATWLPWGLAAQETGSFELVVAIPSSPLADEPAFHAPVHAAFGPDGHELYVVDNFRQTVRVFDLDGRPIREFGGSGRGPGDLMRPLRIDVLPDHVAVNDAGNRRLTLFTREGEYLDARRHPELEPGRPLRYPSMAVHVTHDQLVAATIPTMGDTRGSRPNMEEVVGLVGPDSRMVQELNRFPYGWGFVRRRGVPNITRPPPPAGRLPPGVVWSVSGDSLYVSADAYRGIVRWHRIERGEAVAVRVRDFGWTPEPAPVDESELRQAAAERSASLTSGEVEIVLPEFMGRLARHGMTVAANGDVWLRRHVAHHRDGLDDEPAPHPYIQVPYDEAAPEREVLLPPGFFLRDVHGDLLLGVYEEPEFGVPSIRVYRWRGG